METCKNLRLNAREHDNIFCTSSVCFEERIIYDVQKIATVAFPIAATSIFMTDILIDLD